MSSNDPSKHVLSPSLSSNNHGDKSCFITHKSSQICSGQPKCINSYTDNTKSLNDTLPKTFDDTKGYKTKTINDSVLEKSPNLVSKTKSKITSRYQIKVSA